MFNFNRALFSMQASIIFRSPGIRALLYVFFFMDYSFQNRWVTLFLKRTPWQWERILAQYGKDKPVYAFNTPDWNKKMNMLMIACQIQFRLNQSWIEMLKVDSELLTGTSRDTVCQRGTVSAAYKWAARQTEALVTLQIIHWSTVSRGLTADWLTGQGVK